MASYARKSYLELSGGNAACTYCGALCQSVLLWSWMSQLPAGLRQPVSFAELIGELSAPADDHADHTHHPEQAVYLGGRAILLKAGPVVADGLFPPLYRAADQELYNLPPRDSAGCTLQSRMRHE
jgi:iron complex transport system ATP-binding protein